MARPWQNISRFFRRGLRPLAFGLTAGLVASWLVMALALPLLFPSAAQAAAQVATSQNASQFCMPAVQCHKSMVSQSQCFSTDGCCYEDRCFQLGSPCTTYSSGGSTDKASSTGLCYARSQKIDLTVQIGDAKTVLDIGEYIAAVYRYGVGVAAFLAAIMMMVGGFMYLTAGDSSRVSRGKQIIMDSLLGLGVALSAYVLLNTVNPDLVKLQLPKIPIVKKQAFIGCTLTERCAPCGADYVVYVSDSGEPPPAGDCKYIGLKDKSGKVTGSPPSGWTQGATCVGKSCSLSAKEAGLSGAEKEACSDAKSRCRIPGTAGVGLSSVDSAVKKVDEAYAGSCGVAKDNPGGYVCSFCVQDGGNCNPSGKSETCCSGFCGDGTCTTGLPGSDCDDPNGKECLSGICQENWFDSCSTGDIGSYCSSDSECLKGYQCQTKGNNTCSPGTKFSWCASSDECKSGLTCVKVMFWFSEVFVCMPSTESVQKCSTAANCTNPSYKFCSSAKICTDGQPGAPCTKNDDCAKITRTYQEKDTSGYRVNDGACAKAISTCVKGEAGDPCDDGYDCLSGRCAKTSKTYMCASGLIGSICTSAKLASGVSACEGDLECKSSGESTKSCQYK